ncbi:hypothetical protein GW916_07065 [bacterium]|nr:hypothetical protein [bacterium]
MKKLYNDRSKSGYSQEEAYFARINQDLINKIRESVSDEESDDSNVIEASQRFKRSEDSSNQKDKEAA